MKKKLMALAMACALTFGLSACSSDETVDYVAAMTVDNVAVPEGVFNYYMGTGKDYLLQYGLDLESETAASYLSLIEEQTVEIITEIAVIKASAIERGLEVDADDLAAEMDVEIAAFGSDEYFQEFLDAYTLTEEDVEWIVEFQLLAEMLYEDVTSEVTATDEELEAAYNEDPAVFDQFKYSHILVSVIYDSAESVWQDAYDVAAGYIADINAGTATFEELAANNGDSTSLSGGDLGTFITAYESPYVPEFTAAALELREVGEMTQEPVRTDYGYHLILLNDAVTGYENLSEEIYETLIVGDKNTLYNEFVEAALAEAEIQQDFERVYGVDAVEESTEEPGEGTTPEDAQ